LGLGSLVERVGELGDCDGESWRGESTGDGSSSRMEIRDGEVVEVGSAMLRGGDMEGWRDLEVLVRHLLRGVKMELRAEEIRLK
jgi:hypothetical protein